VAHDDVVVPMDLAVLALTLVVVMTLGSQRQLHVAPVKLLTFHQIDNSDENNSERFTENFINFRHSETDLSLLMTKVES